MLWDEEPQNAVSNIGVSCEIVNNICKLDYTLNRGKREKYYDKYSTQELLFNGTGAYVLKGPGTYYMLSGKKIKNKKIARSLHYQMM